MPDKLEKKIDNAFIGRTDGFIDDGVDCSNPIQEQWILKEKIVKTGDGDDDWFVDLVPVKVGETNLDEQIHEQAKGTDLRSLIAQCVRSGDTELAGLNVRSGNYIDITGYPDNTIDALNAIRDGQIALDGLPAELKAKGVENVISITKADIEKMIADAISQNTAKIENETKSETISEVKEDIK